MGRVTERFQLKSEQTGNYISTPNSVSTGRVEQRFADKGISIPTTEGETTKPVVSLPTRTGLPMVSSRERMQNVLSAMSASSPVQSMVQKKTADFVQQYAQEKQQTAKQNAADLLAAEQRQNALTEELSQISNGTAILTNEGRARAAEIETELKQVRENINALSGSENTDYNEYLDQKYAGKSGLFKAAASIGKNFTSSPAVVAETVKTAAQNVQNNKANTQENAEIAALTEELSRIQNGTAILTDEGRARAAELEAKLDELMRSTAGNSVDMTSNAMRGMEEAGWLQNSATENIKSPVGKFFADTGMSIAQNAALMPLAVVNPALPLAAMGTSAAAQKMYEVSADGKSAGEALGRGLVSGGIEVLTEKLPLESVYDLVKTGGKGVLKNLLKQGGVEATEEGLSYAMNYIADKAARDPDAKWDWADFANSMAAGGVSGLFFGLGGTAVNRVNNVTTLPMVNETTTQTATAPNEVQAGMNTTGQENAVEGIPGQNKTASTGETVNGNGLSAYSEQEITNFSSGKKNKIVSTFADAVNFIRNALSNNQSNEKAYFGKITNDVAQKVLAETGMDVAGYNAILQSDNARHIMKQHGNVLNESARGQVAVTAEDIALIPQVLAAPDRVSVSPELDSRGRTVLIFEKQIGGNYVTMQAVSDGKHALQTDTLFIKKMKNSQDTGYNASQNADHAHNAQGVPPQSSSGTNIRDNSTGVKNNSTQNSDILPIPGSGLNGDTAQRPQRLAISKDGLVDEVDGYGRNTVGSAEAVSPYQEAPTQSVADRMFTEQEMQNHDLESKHQVYTNKQSRYDAEVMLSSDYEGEVERLKTDEWGPAENVEGHMILEDLVEQARKTGADEDWAKVREWKKLYDKKGGTEVGQTLQSRARFANSAANITAEAADFLDSDKAKRLSDAKKQKVMEDVANQSETLENIEEGDTDSLIALIERNSEIRRTTGFFSKKTSKQMDWALHKIAELYPDADSFLRGVAASQTRGIYTDYAKVSFTERAKSLRIQFRLSKIATVMRNLVSNNVFDPIETLSNNIGVAADRIMSRATGQRTTALEKSWASKAKRHGSLEGALKSFVEVGLDADSTGSEYEGTGGRTFKMTGNFLERFLSTWSKFQNYTLTTTDEFQKGGIRAETQENIDKLKRSGKLDADSLNEWADETAKQRTFQNNSATALAMEDARKALNRFHVKDIGAGDILVPFARVPGNLVHQAANYSPVGAFNGFRQMVQVMLDAKNGNYSAEAQAQAARNIGRGVNGTVLLAGFTALAAKGLIKVAGADDEDKEALEKAQGKTGTQWNLSATMRALNGESTEWRDGDMLMSIGFLDPINSIMAAGAFIADAYQEDGTLTVEEVADASFSALFQSVLDLPAMSSINDLITAYEYADGETMAQKGLNALKDYAAGELESFLVPNALRGIATGLDDTVRNRYTGETFGDSAKEGIVSGLPMLRETLPASLDPFGREKTQTGNTVMNILNNNLLPGALTKYKETEVEKTLESVYDATGNAAVYPTKKAPNSFEVDGEKFTLDAEQKDEFMTTAGETALEIMMDMIDSYNFQMMNEETQGQYLAVANEYARAVATVEVSDGKYELTGTNKKISTAEKAGLSAADYIMAKLNSAEYDEDGSGSMTIGENAKAIQNSGMSKKEQEAYWLVTYPEWPEKAAEKGVDISDYINYKVAVYGVEGEKNAAGKTISGSKKKNMIAALMEAGYSQAEANQLYNKIG